MKRAKKPTLASQAAAVYGSASFLAKHRVVSKESFHPIPLSVNELVEEFESLQGGRGGQYIGCELARAVEKTRHYLASAPIDSDAESREVLTLIGRLNTQFASALKACRKERR